MSWQSKSALADDIALDLVGSGVDGIGAREEVHALHRREFGMTLGVELGDVGTDANDIHGEVAKAAVPVGPVEFGDERCAAESVFSGIGEEAHGVEAHNFEAGVGIGDTLSNDRIFVRAVFLCEADDMVELVLERELLAEGGRTAFKAECGHGNFPSAVDFSDEVMFIGGGAVEEDFVEF